MSSLPGTVILVVGSSLSSLYLFIFKDLLIDWLIAMLGLRFCARALSSCGKRGPLFIVVCGSLTIVASLVAEHRLQSCRLSSCGSWAQLLHSMWDPPRPGLEPMSPALAGRFSTTAPPGKPPFFTLNIACHSLWLVEFLLRNQLLTLWEFPCMLFVIFPLLLSIIFLCL